ncbi:DNA polymerase III subunit delta' [Gulosibacter faecalis]|jgi:DNA polymerase-3 subunit delta'|uniref:DNA polymerase III subunit delta n=1 Tax=Gulosibacter faecalis TaxID=272240 RepID=A0ABW5UWB3_9MICO|nr:DNA polymerase III subunit delta' [Gulosibacter faecalis]
MSVWHEVVGQPRAVATFQRAVQGARRGSEDAAAFTNSWLVTGPAGSGRSTIAYAFAAALLCPYDGCGECPSCRQVRARSHADLTPVATETVSIDIKTARELVTRAATSPSGSDYRVIVVEDADRMVERTSNTLLKAIEEPVESTVWVLCAPSEADLLPTIRSRVRVVPLTTPAVDDVATLLERRHGVDHETAVRAATEAQSHVGMASRLVTSPEAWQRRSESLDGVLRLATTGDAVRKAQQWLDLAKSDGEAHFAERAEREKNETYRSLGLEPGQTIPRKLQSIFRELEREQDRRAKRATIDGVDRILTDVQSLWRDLLMLQLDVPVPLVNESQRGELEAVRNRRPASSTIASIEAIALVRRRLTANVPPQLALEELLIGYAVG